MSSMNILPDSGQSIVWFALQKGPVSTYCVRWWKRDMTRKQNWDQEGNAEGGEMAGADRYWWSDVDTGWLHEAQGSWVI